MEYETDRLILRAAEEDDLYEVARTWPSSRLLTEKEAREEISRMRRNHEKNASGRIFHLCLAVCHKDSPRVIRGWCGLDGGRDPAEPEIFVLLEREFRGRGYGTECMKKLLRIAADEYSLRAVRGGCRKENLASKGAMEKAGMVRCGQEENGDPRYRFDAAQPL